VEADADRRRAPAARAGGPGHRHRPVRWRRGAGGL